MDNQSENRDMVKNMASGKSVDVKKQFDSVMQTRAADALNDYKSELAKSVFRNPELASMGLADGEEHIVDASAIGQDTIDSLSQAGPTGGNNEDV